MLLLHGHKDICVQMERDMFLHSDRWTNCSSSVISFSGEEKTPVPGLAEDSPSVLVLGCEKCLGIGLVHVVGCEVASSKSTCAVSPSSLPHSLTGDEDML